MARKRVDSLALFADPAIEPEPAAKPRPPMIPGKPLKGRGKLPRTGKGGMNGMEKAYAAHLDQRKANGEIVDWWFQPFSLNLGDHPDEDGEEKGEEKKARQRGRYTPDFLVQTDDCYLEVHETKGGYFDPAALVRIKWAATKYTFFTFRVITREKGTKRWLQEEITG